MGDKRTAIYAGSFDPPTLGHVDLIERAMKIFDHVIVAVARNLEKSSLFTPEERVEMLQEITSRWPNVEVTSFRGLTAEFAREKGAKVLIRGLRVVSDFELELTMAIANQHLNHDVDTVCLMPSEKYLLLHSKLVREIALFGGDVEAFVPPVVKQALAKKLGS